VLGHRQHTGFHLFAIELQNRRSGALRRCHCDDGETARPAALALNGQMNLGDIAVGGKQALESPLGDS
jgi:hypothetical protein